MPIFTNTPQQAMKQYSEQSKTLKQKLIHKLNKFKTVAKDELKSAQLAEKVAQEAKAEAQQRIEEVEDILDDIK
jgi:hypothetical protein